MKKQKQKFNDLEDQSRIEIFGGEFVGTITCDKTEPGFTVGETMYMLPNDDRFYTKQELKEIAGITLNEK